VNDAEELRGTGSARDFTRGEFFHSELAPFITATVHPSSILPAPDVAAREREFTEFVHDLEHVAAQLAQVG
jgi:DNA polymerase